MWDYLIVELMDFTGIDAEIHIKESGKKIVPAKKNQKGDLVSQEKIKWGYHIVIPNYCADLLTQKRLANEMNERYICLNKGLDTSIYSVDKGLRALLCYKKELDRQMLMINGVKPTLEQMQKCCISLPPTQTNDISWVYCPPSNQEEMMEEDLSGPRMEVGEAGEEPDYPQEVIEIAEAIREQLCKGSPVKISEVDKGWRFKWNGHSCLIAQREHGRLNSRCVTATNGILVYTCLDDECAGKKHTIRSMCTKQLKILYPEEEKKKPPKRVQAQQGGGRKKKPFQHLMTYLKDRLRHYGYKRIGSDVVQEIKNSKGQRVPHYRTVSSIHQFIIDETQEHENEDQYLNRTADQSSTKRAEQELMYTKENDPYFPTPKLSKRMFTFDNAWVYMDLENDRVQVGVYGDKKEAPCASKVHYPFDLNLEEAAKPWEERRTPVRDSILLEQEVPAGAIKNFNAMVGRLCTKVTEGDRWEKLLALTGEKGSGKCLHEPFL
jgi:hypothetical protein